ncbi:hypothetical protein HN958_02070 [Candidatus Falkowbacteria bacterium]|jgi:hypothetical protein|nr:hypothetical protein [Candidatus Falkowbacteria bacterium]MBT7007271.1 hypothetical protein [Candidatus Falkowbacteria bacterium]
MTKNDLQQLSTLFDQKLNTLFTSTLFDQKLNTLLDQKLKTNQEVIIGMVRKELAGFATKKDLKQELSKYATKDDLSKTEERMMTRVANVFFEYQGQVDARLDTIDRKLAERPTRAWFSKWADKMVLPLRADMKKVKYIHRKEWKDLPALSTINKSLSGAKIN